MFRVFAIVAVIVTANAFAVRPASAWTVSRAEAERLCVGKAIRNYSWGFSCAWCGGLLGRCHSIACSEMGCSHIVRRTGIPTY
jgi:hypothetical protein